MTKYVFNSFKKKKESYCSISGLNSRKFLYDEELRKEILANAL